MAAQLLHLDQAADILLHATKLNANFDVAPVHLNLQWNDRIVPKQPRELRLPTDALYNDHWVLNVHEASTTTRACIGWAAKLAGNLLGGLAINCQSLPKSPDPGPCRPFRRPLLNVVGVTRFRTVESMLRVVIACA